MLTDTELHKLVQRLEDILLGYDLHLSTDQFNALHDHIEDLVRRIDEGE